MTDKNIFKHLSKSIIEVSERLGIKIDPSMGKREVWQLIEKAIKDPEIKKLHDEYLAEKKATATAEMREEYGDVIVDELNKWEKLCLPSVHHIVVFKKGKKLETDIIEFERANIEGEQKYYIQIDGLRPKIYKPHGESPYIQWEKEITFRTFQIIEVVTLNKSIDVFELNYYEDALNKAKELKDKYERQFSKE